MAIHPITTNNTTAFRWSFDTSPASQARQEVRRAIYVRGPVPAWAESVISRLEQLVVLPTVDPAGSAPLNLEDVQDALAFLSVVMTDDLVVPWVGRLNTGGVQVTWRGRDIEIEAVFDRARDERVILVSEGDADDQFTVNDAPRAFATFRNRLSKQHLDEPSH